MFIIAFTRSHYLFLFWARSIHSMPSSQFLKIHLNIILLSSPRNFRFPRLNPVWTSPLLSPIRATCPAHLILPDVFTRTILGEEYRSLSSSLCSFLHSPVTSSFLGPIIFLKTLFSNTVSLRSSRNVSDQVSYPYTTTGKIIFLYIWISVILARKLEDKSCYTE